jgi:predicted ATPase
MIDAIKYENFKSLKKVEIGLKKITVLAGLNSAGKSSFIQGLLLSRSLSEALRNKRVEGDIFSKLPLNGNYLLSLGSPVDAITKDSGREFSITIKSSGKDFVNRYFTEESLSENVFDISVAFCADFAECPIYSSNFYYLNAERLGPRIRHWINEKGGFLHCGSRGEYTVEVLARTKAPLSTDEVPESKWLNGTRLEGFQDIPSYVVQWMEFIAPGTDIGDAKIHSKLRSASIVVNGNSPPNVGFGLSYVLPIVTTGLIAKENSIFVVENPEAHLHPKGQSNMGFFLAQMASAGIQVIVETHSEHVVNGIRKASLFLDRLNPSDVSINFFSGITDKESDIVPILLNEKGDLTPFPIDFFDQTRQDLLEILKFSRR